MKKLLSFALIALLAASAASAQVLNIQARPRTANGQPKAASVIIAIDPAVVNPTITARPYTPDGNPLDPNFVVFSDAAGVPIGAFGTMASQNANAVAITGGAINGTTIGAVTPATGAFTTVATTGGVTVGGGQIAFPATQNPSVGANTLDDYEEGTFLATLTADTPPSGVVYGSRALSYVKVGKAVTLSGRLTISSLGTGGAGNVMISSVPFPSASGGDNFVSGYFTGATLASGHTLGGYIVTPSIQLTDISNTGAASLQWSSLSGSFDVMINFTYIATN